LREKEHTKVRLLSKGMRQRLNLAQALLGRARLFIFDEPMSGLDPPGRNLCRHLLTELHRQGSTILFSTHILEDVESLCSRVIVLSEGNAVYDGSVASLLVSGSSGTELWVSGTDQPMQERLIAEGCEIDEDGGGTARILVPTGKDPREVQRLLATAGLFCDRVEPKTKSLEAVLYEQAGEPQGRGR
jgi:ABC-2 type transport system ATP-binding protein